MLLLPLTSKTPTLPWVATRFRFRTRPVRTERWFCLSATIVLTSWPASVESTPWLNTVNPKASVSSASIQTTPLFTKTTRSTTWSSGPKAACRTYLHDDSQAVAHAYGAKRTPEFFLFNAQHELVYQGRMDDSPRNPNDVSSADLADAIEAMLSGIAPAVDYTESIGCSVKWKA